MGAVVVYLAVKRNEELIATLRGLLDEAERGELVDLGGERGYSDGSKHVLRCGAYKDDGKLSKMAFRLQVKAAFKSG